MANKIYTQQQIADATLPEKSTHDIITFEDWNSHNTLFKEWCNYADSYIADLQNYLFNDGFDPEQSGVLSNLVQRALTSNSIVQDVASFSQRTDLIPSAKAIADYVQYMGGGDMMSFIYDPGSVVSAVGGIPAYVDGHIADAVGYLMPYDEYDPDDAVKDAGGIADYVTSRLDDLFDQAY